MSIVKKIANALLPFKSYMVRDLDTGIFYICIKNPFGYYTILYGTKENYEFYIENYQVICKFRDEIPVGQVVRPTNELLRLLKYGALN